MATGLNSKMRASTKAITAAGILLLVTGVVYFVARYALDNLGWKILEKPVVLKEGFSLIQQFKLLVFLDPKYR